MSSEPEPDRLRRGERVLFVSDVHLTPADPATYLAFLRFLTEEAPGARALYVLGDLFDFWIGPRQARMPGVEEVFTRTRALRAAGTDVFFLPGNRDFLLTGAFATAQGLRVLPDIAETLLGDRRVALTHGDLLCTRDVRYLRMRRVVRSDLARFLMDRLPLPLALRIAGGFRAASGREIAAKPAYVLDPDLAEAKRWLLGGYDALVFGHVHKGVKYRVDLGGKAAEIFILDSWEHVPNFVEWTGSELVFRRYRPSPK